MRSKPGEKSKQTWSEGLGGRGISGKFLPLPSECLPKPPLAPTPPGPHPPPPSSPWLCADVTPLGLAPKCWGEETRAERRRRRSALWPRNVPVRENMAIKGLRFHSKAVMSSLKYVLLLSFLLSLFLWHCSFSWNDLSLAYPHSG